MSGNLWSIVLASVGILGLYMAGSRNPLGWAVGVFAQTLWIAYALITEQYGFILSAVAYGYVYSRNYFKWASDER